MTDGKQHEGPMGNPRGGGKRCSPGKKGPDRHFVGGQTSSGAPACQVVAALRDSASRAGPGLGNPVSFSFPVDFRLSVGTTSFPLAWGGPAQSRAWRRSPPNRSLPAHALPLGPALCA